MKGGKNEKDSHSFNANYGDVGGLWHNGYQITRQEYNPVAYYINIIGCSQLFYVTEEE
jgi:hypothetical protein